MGLSRIPNWVGLVAIGALLFGCPKPVKAQDDVNAAGYWIKYRLPPVWPVPLLGWTWGFDGIETSLVMVGPGRVVENSGVGVVLFSGGAAGTAMDVMAGVRYRIETEHRFDQLFVAYRSEDGIIDQGWVLGSPDWLTNEGTIFVRIERVGTELIFTVDGKTLPTPWQWFDGKKFCNALFWGFGKTTNDWVPGSPTSHLEFTGASLRPLGYSNWLPAPFISEDNGMSRRFHTGFADAIAIDDGSMAVWDTRN